MSESARDIIRLLGLKPHPEGGHYRETWRADAALGERACGTAIYYLLEAHEVSRWHRVDAEEIWHWYAGAPLALGLSHDGRTTETLILGPALSGKAGPQIVVPRYCWQTARPQGGWTLAGCTVSPGFTFDGFEMAPRGWEPGAS